MDHTDAVSTVPGHQARAGSRYRVALLAATVPWLGTAVATAGDPTVNVDWNTPVTITGSTDVSTSGSLVYAFNFGSSTALSGSTVIVNTVPFAPFTVTNGVQNANVGSLTINETVGRLLSDRDLSSNTGVFPGLPPAYQFLLRSEVYADNPANLEISMGGLTPGQEYIVQWWSSNAIANSLFRFTTAISGTTQVTLSNRDNGVGQYVIGSFTAPGSTAMFFLQTAGTLSIQDLPLINAIQVRAVPEPSTYAMALLGAGVGGWRLSRARRRARLARDAAAAVGSPPTH